MSNKLDSRKAKPPRRTRIKPGTPMLSAAEQVMLVTARGAVGDAHALLVDGRPVAARESLEALAEIYSDVQVSDGLERQMLYDLPPVWLIDSHLHRRREKALTHYLPGGQFNEHGVFELRDQENGLWVLVHPNDCWSGTLTGAQDFVKGEGLTGLIAIVTGDGVAATVDKLARKFKIGGPGHD
ncbi:hypothetical protein [Paracoccus saliphilus]|uniref:Uncharacterized protein n=1 Tax=Paracoccus saliphilus TaxID=405559 RepID=A0AA45W325_9RHOB|nr:hypothetical protein [Paracoccus saliphilus]WCR04991.1 hypothetical protein JHX88_09915 [Paracoccus saliphilus]SIS71628.1 hypothetical protein SAMN05421772_103220 [Paracoccus saliphilus]